MTLNTSQSKINGLPDHDVMSVEERPEPVLTLDELAEQWSVSTKTLGRWRQRGLMGKVFLIDGRRRLGVLKSDANRFAATNPALVRRGSRFSRLSSDERQHILRRAREMFESLVPPGEIVTRLHADTQRSPETIRQLLSKAGLLDATPPSSLTDRAKQRLYKEFRRGKSIEQLAARFGLSKAKVRLAINRKRAERIAELPLEYMASEEFMKRGAERKILAPMPENSGHTRMPRKPADLPAYIASLYEVPLLTAVQESHLFRKYNFLKYKASGLVETLDCDRPKRRTLDQIERLHEAIVATKNKLVQANLRLVVSVAKKYIGSHTDLFEKISEGNISLMRAIDKFDYTRGFKFSTYATWAIKKNFIRSYSDTIKQSDRFRTGHEELLDSHAAFRANPQIELAAQQERERQVGRILRDLSERERNIICWRFGMEPGTEPKTLKQVGERLGVTKERVRQLESRAMEKLRHAATRTRLDHEWLEGETSYQTN